MVCERAISGVRMRAELWQGAVTGAEPSGAELLREERLAVHL